MTTATAVAYQELVPVQLWPGESVGPQTGAVAFHQETNVLISYHPVYVNNNGENSNANQGQQVPVNGQLDNGYMWSFLNDAQNGLPDITAQPLPPLQLNSSVHNSHWNPSTPSHCVLDQYSSNHSPLLATSSGIRPPPPPYNAQYVKVSDSIALPGECHAVSSYSPMSTSPRKKNSSSNSNSANAMQKTNTSAGSTMSEELCLVCGDKASGYHYNALTCEGCKGFFRRSITRKATYYCKYGGQCDIDMYMRRKCQACRLRKCLDVGMRSELVIPEEQCRLKRESKIKMRSNGGSFTDLQNEICPMNGRLGGEERKSNSPQQVTSTENLSPNPSIAAVLLPEQQELIHRIVVYQEQSSLLREGDLSKLEPVQNTNNNSDEQLFNRLTDLILMNVRCLEDFVKCLPGFVTLSKNDQVVLLNACSTELLVLRMAKKYDVRTDTLHLGPDKSNYESYKWCYSRQLYKRTSLNLCVDAIFEFAKSMARLKVDDAEYALLTAISLFSDRPGLSDPKRVEDIQEVYTSTLQAYIDVQRPRHRTVFARLLMKLTDLRSLGQQHYALLFENRLSNNGQDSTKTWNSCQRAAKSSTVDRHSSGNSNRRASYAGPSSSSAIGIPATSLATSNSNATNTNGSYRTPNVRIKVEPLRADQMMAQNRFRPSSCSVVSSNTTIDNNRPYFALPSSVGSIGCPFLNVDRTVAQSGSHCGYGNGSGIANGSTFVNGMAQAIGQSASPFNCDFLDGSTDSVFVSGKAANHFGLDQSLVDQHNGNAHFAFENRSIEHGHSELPSGPDCNFVEFVKLNNINFFDSSDQR